MGYTLLRNFLCLLTALGLAGTGLTAQPQITGQIGLDTTRWAPVAYLSRIPDFTQLYSISNESIIMKSGIDGKGRFSFDCRDLPPGDHLYRLHFSKKGDPAASLIIGGRDENHLFLMADVNSDIKIRISGGRRLMAGTSVAGYPPNRALLEINQIAGFLDTLDYYGPAVNRDFVRQAVYDKLRQYADTCSNPIISLYALYHSRFESDYPKNAAFYQKYLRKWEKEDSEYFRAFRAQLPVKDGPNILLFMLIGAGCVLAGTGVFIYFRIRKRKGKNPYQSLTVQERKIFSLLKDGRSNKEISDECGISLSTVKSHVNNIYSKLNISSRTDVMDYGRDG
jgi:DNA-binding CsgD family transcriptional regulator